MPRHHLAQLNIARLLAPLDTPPLAGFVARLAEVNVRTEAAPGFVWRFQTEAGDATALRPCGDDRMLVNFSVWETPDDRPLVDSGRASPLGGGGPRPAGDAAPRWADAASGLQRFAAIAQLCYGVAATATLWALAARRPWLRGSVLL